MKKIKISLLIAFLAISFVGCRSQLSVSNGAYSDISLTRDAKEHSIKRLAELDVKGSALFGIPTDKNLNRKQGLVVRFNGINLVGARRIFPMITMAALSLGTGSVIQEISGYKNYRDDKFYNGQNYNLSLGVSTIIGLPVAGAINNQLWSSSLSRAAWRLNQELIEQNPNVDVFLNPKYDIDIKKGIWGQKTTLKAKVMGATIKTDN
jgi:hypothetical protein